jgi:hypothetical protein
MTQGTLQVTRWLGLLFAGFSLFLLAQSAFGIGLSAAGADVLASYRTLFYPLTNIFEPVVYAVLNPMQLSLPSWWRDGFVLYLMFGIAHYRHIAIEVTSIIDAVIARPAVPASQTNLVVLAFALLCAVVWPISLLILPLVDFVARVFINPADAMRRLLRFYGQILRQLLILAAGSTLFLVLNAGLR